MFKKGVSGNPKGREKGKPNKLPSMFMQCLLFAFNELQKDPQANLLTWGRNNTTEFYKIIAKLMPKELDVSAEVKHIIWHEEVLPETPVKKELDFDEVEILPNTEYRFSQEGLNLNSRINPTSNQDKGFGSDDK